MSLKRFLKKKDIKAEFAQRFPKPNFRSTKEILAPPRTNHYSLIGTAFDYLLRFNLEYLNPGTVTRPWVAEWVVSSPGSPLSPGDVVGTDQKTGNTLMLDRKTGEIVPYRESKELRIAKQIVEQAKAVHKEYLKTGKISDAVIGSALLLAQLDPIMRTHYVDENLGKIDSEDVSDLRHLISIVDPELFKSRKLCILNPTFGEGSRLVGGADADILIDDMLIDVKATKNLRLDRDDFNQIIGYYILYLIGGISDLPHQPDIKRLGIYFARHAELYLFPVESVIEQENLSSTVMWFREIAAQGN